MLLLLQAPRSARVRRTSVRTHPHKHRRCTHTRQGGARAMPSAAFLLSLAGRRLCVKLPAAFLLSLVGRLLSLSNSLSRQLRSASLFHVAYRIFKR